VRRLHLDWARGLAVLVMIEAHTLDAWTRLADRNTDAFRSLAILGGFAAPLFLWLSGTALVLAAEANHQRAGDRRTAALSAIQRGLEIFILAFLFRLQALIVTPGSPLITLFRVDILNIMGPSLVVVALMWWLAERGGRAFVMLALLTSVTALITPIVRTAGWVDMLPVWVQWHLRPAGDYTTFSAFPWAGFVFAGAALGVVLDRTPNRSERRLYVAAAGVGLLLVFAGFEAARRPSIYAQSSFWTSSPTFFAIRAGILLLALAATYFLEAVARRFGVRLGPLERLGRSSLFVYWIHVELVYGYASWFLRQRLELWQTLLAFGMFCALMYRAVLAKDSMLARWKLRAAARSPFIIGS
jgi:uncharacterized membrane protein